MSEMVDRVAAAILNRDYMGESRMGPLEAEALARAAIDAMREPTPEMLAAMEPWTKTSGHQKLVWTAGIDTALKGS